MKGSAGKMAKAAATMVKLEGTDELPKAARRFGEMLRGRLSQTKRSIGEAKGGIKHVVRALTDEVGLEAPLPNVSVGQLVMRPIDVTKRSARTLEIGSGGETAILHLKDILPFKSQVLRAAASGRKLTRRQLAQLHIRDLKEGLLRKIRINQYKKVLKNSTLRIPEDAPFTSGLFKGHSSSVMKYWKEDALMHFTDSLEEVEELAYRGWWTKVGDSVKAMEKTAELPGWMKNVLSDQSLFYERLFKLSSAKMDKVGKAMKYFGRKAQKEVGTQPSMGRQWEEIYTDLRKKAGMTKAKYPADYNG